MSDPSELRILHVARYRGSATEAKITAMIGAGVSVFRIRPNRAEFDYLSDEFNAWAAGTQAVRLLPVVHGPHDPHRMVYRTIDFALPASRPHIIHAEEEPDSLAALQLAVARRLFAPQAKLVLHTWQNVNRRKRLPVRCVLGRTLAAADAIVCASDDAVTVLRQMHYTRPAPVILQMGFDPTLFHPRERPRPVSTSAFGILFVGRLAPEKGIDTLIDAVSRLSFPLSLTIAGDGGQRRTLEAQAAAWGLGHRVQFIGSLRPAELADRLHAADVLVLPSRGTPVWKEQFGRILAEAMACRLPVIGSASGAIPEVVGDAGLLFPTDDADALAARLTTLHASPALREQLAERGHERAFRLYTPAALAARTVEFYRTMADGPH